jgi:SAM-dependent methyltransferase
MMGNAPSQSPERRCVCGNPDLQSFSPDYLRCPRCETLVLRHSFDSSISLVAEDESGLYGHDYWYSHQRDLGYPNIEARIRLDLPERCSHWLATLLKYKAPPGTFLELGCAHGGFVALAKWAGFNATGLELSPRIAGFATRTFDIPVLTGPLEQQRLPFGSYDVIALMDVLEHLPDPKGTMRLCLDLLREDGILLIQTPCYREGRAYEAMLADNDPFLTQLRAEQHLYLFSAGSLERMFAGLGAHVCPERAIFAHYDQFVVVGKSPLEPRSGSSEWASAAPAARLAQALIDARFTYEEIFEKWQASEADRAARLAVIEDLSIKLQASEADRAARLAVIEDLSIKLQASETDRAARLAVIEDLAIKLQASEADREARLAVINELSARLRAAEAESEARLRTIHEQADHISAAQQDVRNLKDAIEQWNSSRWSRLLRRIGARLDLPPLQSVPERPWMLRSRPLKKYALSAFRTEFVDSRPDLLDVRGYNRQMIDILFGLRDVKGRVLLDIGASPHGFAMERALENGVREYCGIGLGVPLDCVVYDGDRTGVLMKMNAEQLEIASGAFDAIISLSTFEHFFHPDAVLVEMCRVLKPGGVVLVIFHPVWTSLHGHHLHHIPDVCALLPPWSHLQWTKQELMDNLGPGWPSTASMSIEEVARWVYDSDEINRLGARVLRRLLETSPLAVEWITPLPDELSEAEVAVAQRLSKAGKYELDELAIKGFSALLVKRV